MEGSMKTTYTIDRVTREWIESNREDFIKYIAKVGPELTDIFDGKLDWKSANLTYLIEGCTFLVCKRDNIIVGHMIYHLGGTPLDASVKILRQVSFHTRPDSGRAAYHLFHKFIDIGRKEANHIITALTSHTNIKPETLEKYGFNKLETLYRMEVNNEFR